MAEPTKVLMPAQFSVMHDRPLDERDEVFDTMEEAQAYIDSPLSYIGQFIKVKKSDTLIGVYLIQPDKSILEYKPVGDLGDVTVPEILSATTWTVLE